MFELVFIVREPGLLAALVNKTAELGLFKRIIFACDWVVFRLPDWQ